MSLKPLAVIVYFLLSVIAVSVGLGVYWANQSTAVLNISNQPMPVIPPTVNRGAAAIVTASYCKLRPAKGSVRTSYVSKSIELFQPITSENLPTGCHTIKVPILIPTDLAPDKYRIKYTSTYQINPILRVTQAYYTQEFEIK